jgi:trans-aconitate methyltransferase
MTTWDPDAYLKYHDERTQPSYDLVARIDLARRKADATTRPLIASEKLFQSIR